METEAKANCRPFILGARSNAALGILAGMFSIVYIAVVHFLFTFVGGDDFCRFPIQVFIYRFDYHLK